jgi:galactokinase/mevalonate kinase-like predicted kinase
MVQLRNARDWGATRCSCCSLRLRIRDYARDALKALDRRGVDQRGMTTEVLSVLQTVAGTVSGASSSAVVALFLATSAVREDTRNENITYQDETYSRGLGPDQLHS